MYSWHTQHLAFHLSLLFSPLPMVIKATRTFTSFFAPPQHTAHTHHRKNWIGKKRNWKSTSIRTRLDFIVSVFINNVYYWPTYGPIPNTSIRAMSAIFRWLINEKWISTLDKMIQFIFIWCFVCDPRLHINRGRKDGSISCLFPNLVLGNFTNV